MTLYLEIIFLAIFASDAFIGNVFQVSNEACGTIICQYLETVWKKCKTNLCIISAIAILFKMTLPCKISGRQDPISMYHPVSLK